LGVDPDVLNHLGISLRLMKLSAFGVALGVVVAFTATGSAQAPRGKDLEKPLVIHLPKMGIRGNSHMLMQDRNNLQLAGLVIAWIDNHVETQRTGSGR
jgi:hypothetical protein